jgi:2-polyprenyl-3-methyl-5-hydroxy-6-metoxy-1,4-benzoquinol methylase
MDAALEHADVETSSAAYARRFAGAVGEWFLEVQARATLDLLRPWPRATVLDVGGGHGQLTGPLVEAGFELVVLGSDESCRARVRDWVDRGRARFQTGDLLRLPFGGESFDLVLSYRLLPHVARWRDLVGELCRVARRAVLVDYPTTRSLNAVSGALFGLKRRVEGDTRPFAVFRDAEIEDTFGSAGFRISARRPEFFLPMALHRAMGLAALSRGLEAGASWVGLTRALGSPVIARFERRG